VVTIPYSVGEGINIFLAGFVPAENLRFRDDELTFNVVENDADKEKADIEEKSVLNNSCGYPAMIKTMGSFKISVHPGQY
jgi:ATP-binding cassette subfamily E protein 1